MIAEHADRSRFDLTFASLSPAGEMQDEMAAMGVGTFALDCTRRPQFLSAILRLRHWLRERRVDVIQTHLFEACLVGLSAARLAGTPLAIMTGHHSAEISLHGKRTLLMLDSVCSRWLSHRVIAPSSLMKDIYVRDEGVPAHRIAVITHGLDLAHWAASREARARGLAAVGLQGKTVFGSVGRLFWTKNYDGLLKAFASLAKGRDDLALLLVGEGVERSRLLELVEERGLRGRVVLPGWQREGLRDYYGAIDVFVQPSLAESFGLVTIEAMALGKPIVSTNVGISRDVIEDGLNGLLVKPGDVEGLRDAMSRMLEMRDRWPAIGEENRKRAQSFSAKSTVAAYHDRYARWLASRPDGDGA